MEVCASRLASFGVAHKASKKRTSNSKAGKHLRWPHKTPNPEKLADAGFFFAPTASATDNTTCFVCTANIDGWEAQDDPLEEHRKFSPHCGWATVRSIEQNEVTEELGSIDPRSEDMVEARRATFLGKWPHEEKRGWVCKIQRLVEAGWYFCPTPESEDFVKCAYCSLGLDGWEPKDNPYTEHQRRSPDCTFFTAVIPIEKPQKGRGKRQSKASSRLSTQSNNTRLSNASSANWEVFGEDSVMTVENSAMLPSQPAAIRSQGSKRTRGSSMSRSHSNVKPKADVVPSSFLEPEDDDFEVKVVEPPGKRSRGRKRKSDEIDQSSLDHQAGSPASGAPEPAAKRRTTRSRTSNVDTVGLNAVGAVSKDSDIQMTDVDAMPPPPASKPRKGAKGGRKRASSKTRHASAASTASMASLRAAIPDDDALDAALEADLNRALADEEIDSPVVDSSTAKRRLTRTRPGTKVELASTASVRHAAEASLMKGEVAAEPVGNDIKHDDVIEKPKRRVASRQKVPAPTPSAPTENTKAETSESRDESAPKKRGTKGKRVAQKELEERQEVERTAVADVKEGQQDPAENSTVEQKEETEPNPTVDANSCQTEDNSAGAKRSRTTKKTKVKTKVQQLPDDYPAAERSSTAVVVEEAKIVREKDVKVSDDESTLQRKTVVKKPIEKVKKGAKAKAKAAKASTPPPVLPSSSPEQPHKEVEDEAVQDQKSLPTPIVEVTPVKQASAQPFTSPPSDVENHPPSSRPASARPPLQTLSPSKFQPIRVPLALSTPVASPSKNISKLHTTQPWIAVDFDTFLLRSPEKENAMGAAGGLFALPKAKGNLSSPEKKMTVEQWIKANAENLEGKLRDDCERLVGRFEAEGMKALRTLEGVVCRG